MMRRKNKYGFEKLSQKSCSQRRSKNSYGKFDELWYEEEAIKSVFSFFLKDTFQTQFSSIGCC
jgi:hypothetical protein